MWEQGKGDLKSSNRRRNIDEFTEDQLSERTGKSAGYLRKEGKVPTLLLHSCCAPCSSYVLEYLSEYFKITVFYYNPNIYPESEYTKRILEQQKLISEMHFKNSVSFLAGSYDKEQFYEMAKGLEEVKEGGVRCMKCYKMRLKKTAQKAAERI